MIMPVGPIRLECKQCGRTQWNLGYSDCIRVFPCECGSEDFEFNRLRIPRNLWPLARAAIKITQKY